MIGGGPLRIPAGMNAEWHCETCLRHCVASDAHKKGCVHYLIYGSAWKARARLEHERLNPPPNDVVEAVARDRVQGALL